MRNQGGTERADSELAVPPSNYEGRDGCDEPKSDESGEDVAIGDDGAPKADVEGERSAAEEIEPVEDIAFTERIAAKVLSKDGDRDVDELLGERRKRRRG